MAGSLSRAEQPRAHCPGTVQVAFKASCLETEAALLTAKLISYRSCLSHSVHLTFLLEKEKNLGSPPFRCGEE